MIKDINSTEFKKLIFDYEDENQEEGWNFKLFYFIIKKEKMTDFIIRTGPPTNLKSACERFKSKHKKTYTKNKYLYVKLKRIYKKPENLVKELLKDSYIKQRVKNIKL